MFINKAQQMDPLASWLVGSVTISQTLKWIQFLSFLWRRLHSFVLAMFPHRKILVRFFIPFYFVSDFSFCFKYAFFGLFDYSKENTGKFDIINLCFLLAKFHIHKQKFGYWFQTSLFIIQSLFRQIYGNYTKGLSILKLWKLYFCILPLCLCKVLIYLGLFIYFLCGWFVC